MREYCSCETYVTQNPNGFRIEDPIVQTCDRRDKGGMSPAEAGAAIVGSLCLRDVRGLSRGGPIETGSANM